MNLIYHCRKCEHPLGTTDQKRVTVNKDVQILQIKKTTYKDVVQKDDGTVVEEEVKTITTIVKCPACSYKIGLNPGYYPC